VIEYLRSDNTDLEIKYTAASGITSVVFEVYDLDTNDFVQAGTAASGASSIFTATLDKSSIEYDRNLKFEWISSTASGSDSTINYYSIATPYATATRIRSLASIDSSVTDSTLEKEEKKARNFINSMTRTTFTKKYDTIVVYGNNTDILTLSEPILEIHKIYEDDILMYDSVSTASFNNFDYNIEPSVSKWRIKAISNSNSSSARTISDDRELLESPDISVIAYDGIFKKDCAYKVVGIFGYSYVPNKIELASALLVEDYLCNDWNIRNKGIQSTKNDSYEIQYGKDFAGGTGNLMVDALLADWTQTPSFMAV